MEQPFGRYILIVEDSRTQTAEIEAILKQLGYRTAAAYNGKEALDLMRKEKPLLVVTDILMPEMDGYELCTRIKSDSALNDTPVVLLTQLSDPKEIIRGLECRADDFIVKPYTEQILLSRIKTVLGLKLQHEISIKHINILVVDDSPTQANQLKYRLEENGYAATTALNGNDGYAIAKKLRPHLIISDILMPLMDGYELADKIKHDPELKKTPIILLTSLRDSKDAALKARVFADSFITKPYDVDYLLSKIESILAIPPYKSDGEFDRRKPEPIEVSFANEKYTIMASRRKILTFLLSTYENAVQQNRDLIHMSRELQQVNEQLEDIVIERTRQLQTSETNYRTLLEASADAIVVVGGDRSILFANSAARQLLGVDKTELAGKLLAFDAAPGETKDVEITDGLGVKTVVDISVIPTKWADRPASLVTMHDVTERKEREKEFLKASKLESLGILAGGIAHDFNNLLTGMLGNASLARIYADPKEKIYKIITDIEKASLRAKDLTQQLLTFAKGGMPIKKTMHIKGLIMDSATFAMHGSNIKCAFSIAEDLKAVDVDEGQLNQVMHNLVINAKQAMPDGGAITITAVNTEAAPADNLPLAPGGYVRITVRDNGMGIPEELLTKIFDPYFTTKAAGTGLGLATVYSVIKNHGGCILAESRPGSGTAFHIYLPQSDKAADPAAAPVEGKPVRGAGRIIIMDDEDVVRNVAAIILKELGYDVDTAANGGQTIELYKKAQMEGRPYSVLIMDLTIPGGMGGKEAIARLREIDPDVRAIVSSGYSDDPIMSDYRKNGFKDVIVKPYKMDELSSVIQRVIAGSIT